MVGMVTRYLGARSCAFLKAASACWWWRKSVWMHVAEYNTSMQCYLQPIRRMKSYLSGMTMTSQLRPCPYPSACRQAPNIAIQCPEPDWQRPAWQDPAGMHTSHGTTLEEMGVGVGSTFQCELDQIPVWLKWAQHTHVISAHSHTWEHTHICCLCYHHG